MGINAPSGECSGDSFSGAIRMGDQAGELRAGGGLSIAVLVQAVRSGTNLNRRVQPTADDQTSLTTAPWAMCSSMVIVS
jgi:hypothetical protein